MILPVAVCLDAFRVASGSTGISKHGGFTLNCDGPARYRLFCLAFRRMSPIANRQTTGTGM